ncbi:kinesin-like protein [Euroglyphus maynei]|uniref:Kinesin-like protein n=1 Tax=Euroglyphus maynei TaxID=6958 RepID=A0A1Y3BKA3_EURMA|nr:kinesin-like protein [Euroglyphus maynei]
MLESLMTEEKDALLFAYGITSSGKSYTINGTPNAPGLIPRTLAYLFHKIRLNRKNRVISNNQNGFYMIDNHPDDNNDECWSFNEAIASMTLSYERRYSQTLKQWSRIRIEICEEDDEEPETTTEYNSKRYCLFLSFVEIYNNYIYDLLEIPDPKRMKWIRTKRTLMNDGNQMVYVQGAAEIQVNNLDQAFRVFLYGLQNRQIATTMMNEQSSRSHSVFTIKLVHCDDNDDHNNHHKQLKVRQFSIVDLAGLERANRTQNMGKKLSEAGQINSSLMTLRAYFSNFVPPSE